MMVMKAKRVTMLDIAKTCGVSKASVSFAFNDPKKIKRETYEKIMETARELDYIPNPMAKRLSEGKSYTIGFLLPQKLDVSLNNPYTIEVLKGIGELAEKRGYTINLIPPLHSSIAEAVKFAAVDGIITMGISIDENIKDALRRRRIPVVSIDGREKDGLISVNIDDEKAAYEQMSYVLRKGHREIAVIALGKDEYGMETEEDTTSSRRLRGYERALKEYGLSLSRTLLFTAEPTLEEGKRVFDAIMKAGKNVSCIVSMADVICYGLIKGAWGKGLTIPSAYSIIGFDGLNNALSEVRLTSIKQPASEKGEKATELLFSLLDGNDEKESVHYVKYELTEGESVKKRDY